MGRAALLETIYQMRRCRPMPIYEYACTACGERTEARQSFDDPPLEECPLCGGKLRKLYSPVGIVFKGSGFYATEGRRSTTTGASKDESSSSGSQKKKDAKKDSSGSGDKSGGGGKAEKSA
jgi:putative FmdB family regulatory protein